jgi:hypothetical protein
MIRCPNCGWEPLTLIIPAEYGPAGWGLECDTCGFTHDFPVRVCMPAPPMISMQQIRCIERLSHLLHQTVPPLEAMTQDEANQYIVGLREAMRQVLFNRHHEGGATE